MSKISVSVRAFLVLAVLGLIAVTGAVAIAALLVEQHSQRTHRNDRLAAAAAFVERRGAHATSSNWRRAFARRLAALQLRAEITLMEKTVDARGKSLVSEKRKKRIYVSAGLRPDDAGQAPQRDRASDDFEITTPASAEHTFPFWEEPGSVLRLRLYASPLDRSREALIALASGLLALLAGLALLIWIASHWIVRPLRQLSSQVDAIAGGESAVAPSSSRISEVTNVANAVTGMAETLAHTADNEARVEAKRRFLVSAVAHDLRTPLFSLRGYLDAIAAGIGQADQQLEKARAKAAQIDRLVTSLFAYARADLDEQPRLEKAELEEAVRRATSAFELAANERGVTLRLSGNGVAPVTIDRDRFERALANVLDNALRYSPEGGVIDIAYGRDASGAYVRVDDHGPGIDADLLPHVFEPMVRIGRARKHTGGAGLGLTIAARLLESQGGTIGAANRPEGGASLTLRLHSDSK